MKFLYVYLALLAVFLLWNYCAGTLNKRSEAKHGFKC